MTDVISECQTSWRSKKHKRSVPSCSLRFLIQKTNATNICESKGNNTYGIEQRMNDKPPRLVMCRAPRINKGGGKCDDRCPEEKSFQR